MRFERDPESGFLVPQREIIAPRRRFALPIFRRYGAQQQAMLAQSISPGGYDTDAQAFFTAASITDNTQKDAVNSLVIALKSASIWSKMIAIYPFVGAAATPHSYNLKNPSVFQITWAGGVTHNSDGITGNGTTGSGDTGLNFSSDTTANSSAFGVYSKTDSAQASADMGAGLSTGSANIYPKFVDNNAYFRNTEGTGGVSAGVTTSLGLFVCSRTSSSSVAGYQASGTPIATGSGAQGTRDSANFTLLTFDIGFSARNLAFAFVSDGLADSEVGDLNTAVVSFQTTLGRNA